MRILDPGLQYVGQEVNFKCGSYLSLHLWEKTVSEIQTWEEKQDRTFLKRFIETVLQYFKSVLKYLGTTLMDQWLRLHIPNKRGPGLIPGQGTRSHMLQLTLGAAQLIIYIFNEH